MVQKGSPGPENRNYISNRIMGLVDEQIEAIKFTSISVFHVYVEMSVSGQLLRSPQKGNSFFSHETKMARFRHQRAPRSSGVGDMNIFVEI